MSTSRTTLPLLALLALAAPTMAAHDADGSGPDLLTKFCGDCHNATSRAGGVRFDTLQPQDSARDVQEWEKHNGIDCVNNKEEIIKHGKVIELFQQEIDQLNTNFGDWEKIKRFELTPIQWGIPTGEMTPTLKLKRKVIMEKHADLFKKIYGYAGR